MTIGMIFCVVAAIIPVARRSAPARAVGRCLLWAEDSCALEMIRIKRRCNLCGRFFPGWRGAATTREEPDGRVKIGRDTSEHARYPSGG